ncbi:biopolymer transporter ExbB [Lysobacteraceae bacterium NML75-0749]|nr:biopolymer transporter ExbB [Xanthomonadaceae bacterium NML75-0749]PJK02838.1 biopolymer transporter ExbB [Xanthomonadaceae bacterium NML71-0210]PJK03255.1 biopolymer transporter ExbB [Xanthomonadaceae bacterium NML91-0268]PJK09139.1 biopolymer transporter ExbB [Xanthomonadaceae bacterium NML95-0200]PJK13973.1 biopolymer transporter ExbB [Xanthomonadaceae bacterium NML07-0707]
MLQQTPAPAAGGSNAEAFKAMGFQDLIQQFDLLLWVVFLTLVLFSVLSIYYFVVKSVKYAQLRGNADRVVGTFWQTPNAQDAIRFMEEQPAGEPFSKIALDAAKAAAHHQRHDDRLTGNMTRSELVDRALRQAVVRESSKLQNGMTLLATVGATAPFIGLLGTVWGIYHALIAMGASGDASISAVAGPVGEALIMTAIGLFVAIPAVIIYNFFNRQNSEIIAKFDAFAHDLHDFFATGSRMGDVGR